MPLISIIVPTKKINNYIKKSLIPALKKQTYKNFELFIVPDYLKTPAQPDFPDLPFAVKILPSDKVGPAKKRDLVAKKAKGKILAFVDSDAYPDNNWLKNALPYFKNKNIAAVCGPGITPPTNNLRQKVSGWVWQSWLGAGAAGTYRCNPEEKREVDDYPSFNLIVRKKDFEAVGGFNSKFWPGEDTKLCHDLVYKLKKKIIYYPKILVYHHRREIFIPHLKQISRFGWQRGHFARILPKTSLRLGYFIPSLFVLFLFLTPIIFFCLAILNPSFLILLRQLAEKDPLHNYLTFIYLSILAIYFFLLLLTSLHSYRQEKNLLLSLLLIPTIFLTHLVYGVNFIRGFFSKKLDK